MRSAQEQCGLLKEARKNEYDIHARNYMRKRNTNVEGCIPILYRQCKSF